MTGPHLMYSKAAGKAMSVWLGQRMTPVRRDAVLARTREIYLGFLPDIPELGGKKNFQAQAVYDTIALLALWEAMDPKPSNEDFEALSDLLFVPQMMGRRLVNFNRRWVQRYAHAIFSFLARRGRKKNWPGNYHMEVEPYDPEVGVRFRFTTCPIADFARTHGYTHLMGLLCNADYPMLETIHARLIRTKTCSCGDCCDYWLVGDESPHAAAHPTYRDEAGYIKNR